MSTPPALYDQDFFLWTQAQAAALRDGKAQDLDWSNLAEEIESLGKSDRRALGSHLGRVGDAPPQVALPTGRPCHWP